MMRRLKVSVNSVIQLKSLCEEWEESVCTEKRKPQIFKKKEVSIKVFQVQSPPPKTVIIVQGALFSSFLARE